MQPTRGLKIITLIMLIGLMVLGYGGSCSKKGKSTNTGSSGDPAATFETISTPNQPTGAISGTTGTSYDYSTVGASSDLGHSIEYQFDWGDGTYSTWSSSTTASVSWASAGTYIVKVWARCATHTWFVSGWSSGLSVIITGDSETVSIPAQPTGTISGTAGTSYSYSTNGASSNFGHPIEYQFDWKGDGTDLSAWGAASQSKAWQTDGTYLVKARARCTTHTSIVSNWSSGLSVNIYPPPNIWVCTTIDSVGDVGLNTSIAIDSNNKVHISYSTDSITTDESLKYATNASGLWGCTTIDTGFSIADTSIAIDSNNKVHISYNNSALKYATNISGAWGNTIVTDEGAWTGSFNSIAIDSNNKVHISYNDWDDDNLRYVTNASGSWNYTTIDSTGNVGSSNSIALDSNNKVHISYRDYDNKALKYATNATGSWVSIILDSTNNGSGSSSIAIDSNNKVHISYVDYANQNLTYATNASDSWVYTTIDSGDAVGESSSIALDSNNKVHISYLDSTNYDLKYATNAYGSWVTTTIDSAGDVGLSTSIAIDSNNKVHISYYDLTNGDLKYATNK